MRRVAVGHQERLEAMAAADGWLSEGHGLDLTMLATAANFETRTNGATHMGNDDCTIFDGLAHVRIIDVSCPQQMLSIMTMDHGGQSRAGVRAGHANAVGGDLRRRLHVRIRAGPLPARRARMPRRSSSAAAAACTRRWPRRTCARQRGVDVGVIDMPSIDEDLLVALVRVGQACLPGRTEQRLHSAEPLQGALPARKAWRLDARRWPSTRSTPMAVRGTSIRARTKN